MVLSIKTKIILAIVCSSGVFLLGRATAPKPKPEIRMIDNSKSIEQAIEATRKQMLEQMQKQVVLEKHTTKSKSGEVKTDVKEVINYNKNTSENIATKTKDKTVDTSSQNVVVKPVNNFGIDFTFMTGRPVDQNKYDYFAGIGVPLVAGIKGNAGYEFNNKMFFVGSTYTLYF